MIHHDEQLADSNCSEARHEPIWLANADMNDMDELYTANILEISFRQWLKEAEELDIFDNALILCNAQGRILRLAGRSTISGGESESVQSLAGQACRTLQQQSDHGITALPIMKRSEKGVLAVLAIVRPDSHSGTAVSMKAAALLYRSIVYRNFELSLAQEQLHQQQLIEKEAGRRETLFEVARRLHDQNDVNEVLNVLLMDVEDLYPHAEFDLYLSQDHVNGDERIKPLYFRHADHDIHAQAFLAGNPIIAHDEAGMVQLAIPMSGKQAVYGVLSIAMRSGLWEESEMSAFIMLADTAGSAFESGKLFEQSNALIRELQIINEITKRLNQSLRLDEIFQFAMNELLTIFKADYCAVLQLDKDTDHFHIMSTNLREGIEEVFSTDYGFCGIVYDTKEPLIISDYAVTRVVDSQLMDVTASRSMIAAPIMAGTEVAGVIMVMHQSPNFFSYGNYKLLQMLSTHIGLAISNASLHAEVRRMVITDNLTGLHARHYLNKQIQSRQRKDPCGSLVLVDLDHFKKVNDTYGHLIGDRILVAVSDVIRSCIRETDIAARWGGEELAVYLPQIRSEQAYRIAERIRSRVEQDTHPPVTVSCGISEWTYDDEKVSVETLFNRADVALYEAKNNGRNRIVVG
nr:sensor domain-containing diguanylate cyclase [Paenibacillus oenotherae]